MQSRVFVAVGGCALALGAPAWACRDGAGPVQRAEYSVGYATPAALRAAATREHGTVVGRVPALHIARIRVAPSASSRVSRLPGIRFVQRVTTRVDAGEPALQVGSGQKTPLEWQFAAAREDAVPDGVLRAAGAVTIAVIDTGADLGAPDIAAKNPLTYSPRTGSADIRDATGHGTFVAALAAGSVTNGDGIAGFGGDAKLMIVKAGAGDGSISDTDEAAAIAYAVDHGARIINLSFGGTAVSTAEKNAVEYAAEHGVLVVAAAGNSHLDGNPVVYPAALLQPVGSKGVGGIGLAVGASTHSDARAPFSSTGTYLSLAAPGDGVFSAVASSSPPSVFPRESLPGASHGLYGFASGTSFAAPEVAGAAALVMAANPALHAADVARVLKQSASGRGDWSPELGFGVLDVGRAVDLARDTRAQLAHALLKLGARVTNRRVKLTAVLAPDESGIATAARSVVIERYRHGWKPLATVQTRADGKAVLTLRSRRVPLKVRARWPGAADLAAAASRPVTVRASH
jgi:subtilisin family serine protease